MMETHEENSSTSVTVLYGAGSTPSACQHFPIDRWRLTGDSKKKKKVATAPRPVSAGIFMGIIKNGNEHVLSVMRIIKNGNKHVLSELILGDSRETIPARTQRQLDYR